MYKIAAVGDRNSVYGFASLGLKVYFAEDGAEAKQVIRTLAAEEYAVIYIVEDLAARMEDELAKYKGLPLPAITTMPGIRGSTGYGMTHIRTAVERAVGADILVKE